jgi:hypothetical protein
MNSHRMLCLHPKRRYLMRQDGQPFFYLADTAWQLFHNLRLEEAKAYLDIRARQGFNVIQAVALAEYSGLNKPNAYGRRPLLLNDGFYDPARPDLGSGYDYWQHMDAIIDYAAEKGLYIGLLPTWGDKFNVKWGSGPEIFNKDNAAVYAGWLAARHAGRDNIVWILGGDRPLENDRHRDVIDAMGQAIRSAAPQHLITFHPPGGTSSVDQVAAKPYIDFHMIQSGHGLEAYQSWKILRRTASAEKKPFFDGEPRYEGHPACFIPDYDYFWDADDVRQNAWWNLMEGVCGHTYGHHSVWYFNRTSEDYWPYTWQEALHQPAAEQMVHLAKLRLSRPYFDFRPAPELVMDDSAVMAHQAAARGDTYAYIYSPLGLPVRSRLEFLGGKAIRAAWFDPRSGEEKPAHAVVPPLDSCFVPPSSGKGQDWVLILDRLD